MKKERRGKGHLTTYFNFFWVQKITQLHCTVIDSAGHRQGSSVLLLGNLETFQHSEYISFPPFSLFAFLFFVSASRFGSTNSAVLLVPARSES